MSLTENAFMTGRVREGLARSGFVDWGAARGFAERIIKGVSPTPHRDHVARPAMGSRRSRLHESVGYAPDGASSNGHGH
jgi:hypothetical protein